MENEALEYYLITYDLNGGEGDFGLQYECIVGCSHTIISDYPTRDGYSFMGWLGDDGQRYFAGAHFYGELLVAQWQEIPTGTVTFDLNGGTGDFPPITHRYDIGFTIPETPPTKERCEFYGWYNKYGDYFAPGSVYNLYEEQDTLTASWGLPMYIFTFDPNGGTYEWPGGELVTQQPIDTAFPIYAPYREGHNFLYWEDTEGNRYVYGDWYPVTNKDMTFTAHWERYAYVMSYEGIETHDLVNMGESYTVTSTVPTKEGHDFVCWRIGDETYNAGDLITPTEDMTFEAVWTPHHYTISFDLNGGTGVFAPIDKTYGVDITLPEGTPAREGFVFDGWQDTDGEKYSPGAVYTKEGHMTLTAVWKEIFTLTYLNDDGTVFATQSKIEGESITLYQETPEKAGEVFKGWSISGNPDIYSPGTEYIQDGNVTLTVVWKEKYTLTYLNDDGTVFATQSKIEGERITLYQETPEKAGYAFTGWSASGTAAIYLPSGEFTRDFDTTLSAQFTKTTLLAFHNGGTVYDIVEDIAVNGICIPEETPQQDIYEFFCWKSRGYNEYYLPGEKYLGNEDMGFNAVWCYSDNVRVVYDVANSSDAISDHTISKGATITLSDTIPERKGYIFRGWTDADRSNFNSEQITTVTMYHPGETYEWTSSKRLLAVWEKDQSPITENYDIGKYGEYSINVRTGAYHITVNDMDEEGMRMPVTVKHIYDSVFAKAQHTTHELVGLNCADFSSMNVGLGFKLNLMQSMRKTYIVHKDGTVSSYVYTDENGTETYFVLNEEKCYSDKWGDTCWVFSDKDGGDADYDPQTRIMKSGSEEYLFDAYGRLMSISDEFGNAMSINYTDGQITSVVDGAGREFVFEYSDTSLIKITAPDGTHVDYTYDEEGYLKTITYSSGTALQLSYASSKKLSDIKVLDSQGVLLTSRNYSSIGGGSYAFYMRGAQNGSSVGGKKIIYDFSNPCYTYSTHWLEEDSADGTEEEYYTTVYTFDKDGALTGQHATFSDASSNGSVYFPDGTVSYGEDVTIKAKNYSDNLILSHRGENMTNWTITPESDTFSAYAVSDTTTSKSKYGQEYFELTSDAYENVNCGMYQTLTLPAGEYTYSAYIRIASTFNIIGVETPGAYIAVKDSSGNLLSKSEVINFNNEVHNRIATSFTLTAETTVKVWLAVNGKGKIYADALQLEQNPYATSYNMLENGSFESSYTNGWITSNGISRYLATGMRMPCTLKISGSSASEKFACQTVPVKTAQSTRETFTLSGWAKGSGSSYENSAYRLRAVINYADGEAEEHSADFTPSVSAWQYASVQFSKEKYKAVNNITVYCDYNYQSGSAYFDALEFTRDYIETGLSEEDFYGNDSSSEEETTSSDVEIEEAKDAFGNIITETTHTNAFSEGVIYRSFNYGESGNNLVKETDPRGNVTTYEVDETTSRNTTVIDRCGNKTSYSYDGFGRVNSIISTDSDNFLLSRVAYSYDPLDNITEISRNDGQKYTLTYDAYRNLEAIGVDGRDPKLITYTRRAKNGRVKKIAYANGDYMKASYNNMGYMISEKWYDSNDTLKYEYIYSYDNEGNVVKTIDKENSREYNYLYEEGNIVRSTEYDISGETKVRLVTVYYVYNEAGELVRKRIIPREGNEEVYQFTNTDNESKATLTSLDASYIARTTTDNLGRKITDTLGDITKSYTYHVGAVTSEHKANNLNLGNATTQLVKKITYSDTRTLEYEYDNEERITKVTDSVEGTTVYTYDALGQLISEVKNGITVNTMTYDDYGNIKSKNGKTYTYGNSNWKDLLTSYDGNAITYDEQGNPTSYMETALVWEKGRQLKSFGTTAYKYNANGIRIYKSVGDTAHHYILDGTKILKETYGTNTIIPLYDNEESVCGIVYNGTTYYFTKNLQGDVISITNPSGTTLARYSYDAWGKCTITEDTTEAGIATVNPYRYRSYYYDTETALYYLQSRYYDPEIGRFLNADEAEFLGVGKSATAYNLIAYCGNDVMNSCDPTGFKDINITKKLNKVMLKNAKYLHSLAKLYRWGGIAGMIALLYKFYSLVKTGGKWDFKNQKEWKLKSGDHYIYDSEKISAEEVGNIHFGYVGSVLFSWKTLCAGAGLYQIYSGTSSLSYWYSFFDDPRDTKRISQGRVLWRKFYNKFVFQW